MHGTRDRSDNAPLTPDGNQSHYDPSEFGEDFDPADMVGCHSGRFRALNVAAQPGFDYAWHNNSPRDILAARMRGFEIVDANDPERAALAHLTNAPGQLDSSMVFENCVLMRRTTEATRAEADEREAENLRRIQFAGMDFAKDDPYERQLSPRGPVRFRTREHRLEFHDGDRAVDQWTPDKGVISEG